MDISITSYARRGLLYFHMYVSRAWSTLPSESLFFFKPRFLCHFFQGLPTLESRDSFLCVISSLFYTFYCAFYYIVNSSLRLSHTTWPGNGLPWFLMNKWMSAWVNASVFQWVFLRPRLAQFLAHNQYSVHDSFLLIHWAVALGLCHPKPSQEGHQENC